MLDHVTSWPRLYAMAALAGAAFGLLLSAGGLPSAPDWPEEWSMAATSSVMVLLVPVAGGALIGLVLAAVAHLGVRTQLRRDARHPPGA